MPTELERAALMLESKGYVVGQIKDGGSKDAGIIDFFDPHTLKGTWPGKLVFGRVRFSSPELNDLRKDPNAKSRIFQRVREAELRLLADLRGKPLEVVGVSLSLTLLCIYPLSSLIA